MSAQKLKAENKGESTFQLPDALFASRTPLLKPLLKRFSETKEFPSSFLITGIAGSGLNELVYFLITALLCMKKGETPCGECENCRRSDSRDWIQLEEIAPEISEEGKVGTIKIEELRSLKESAGFSADENSYRIVLIHDASRMTNAAANSLLKLLEEPPRGWIFILTSPDLESVLPTLISRCQRIRVPPFQKEELIQALIESGTNEDDADFASSFSQGSYSKALSLLAEESKEFRKLLLRFFSSPETLLNEVFEFCSESDSNLNLALDQIEFFVRELLSTEGKGKELLAHHEKAKMNFGSLSKAEVFWQKQAAVIAEVRKKIPLPLNRKLLIQEALLPWLAVTSSTTYPMR